VSVLPQINLRRTYLIARRDFLGYVKTWGFWISFFLPFIFGALAFFATTLDFNVSPTRYEAILDDTGRFGAQIIESENQSRKKAEREVLKTIGAEFLSPDESQALLQAYDDEGLDGAVEFANKKFPSIAGKSLTKQIAKTESKTIFVDPPAATIDELQPFLKGEKTLMYKGQEVQLNGVLHLYEKDGMKADYWSENFNNHTVRSMASKFFRKRATERYLATGDLTIKGYNAARAQPIDIQSYDPTKTASDDGSGQAVTAEDRIPYFVAAILSVMLWLMVFSGSYMLLTSMLEEKLNKLLEMMLASTRFSEIMFGKLLGVAALTFTAMLPYILVGIGSAVAVYLTGDAETSQGIKNALSFKMLSFFAIFLVLGYVFYGAFFIALGALAESMQDAQTLTTPIMLILTACIFVVPLGLGSPDSPLLTFASWFPVSAPFAAIVRLPSDPPLWELCLSAFFVFLCAVIVIWLAGRIFRFGVLSGSGMQGVKLWFMRSVLRRKTL